MPDTLSILTSEQIVQTKIWQKDGTIKPSANAKYFDLNEREIDNMHELHALLSELADDPYSCFIRGRYAGDNRAQEIDPTDYKDDKVLRRNGHFEDQPLHALMIDIDDFEPILADPLHEPEVCIDEFIVSTLPKCFHNVSYSWQASASAGKKGSEDVLKVHLWFWLRTPYTSAQLKSWAEANTIDCDHKLFNPVQIHFTASPIFEAGIVDPIQKRRGFFEGHKGDEVDLIIDDQQCANSNTKLSSLEILDMAINRDPIAKFLMESELVTSRGNKGELYIDCPFKDGHSKDTKTSTLYFPAHTNGRKYGNIFCHHDSCKKYNQKDFLEALGCDAKPILNKKSPLDRAEWFIETHFNLGGIPTLKRHQGHWYLYSGTSYDEVKDEQISNDIWRILGQALKIGEKGIHEPFNPTLTDVNATLNALRASAENKILIPNTWNDGRKGTYISLKNKILNVHTRETLAHSPEFFTMNSLPFDYQTQGQPERWLAFLNEIFNRDTQSIECLQEIFGYCVTTDTSFQKMFLFVGPRRSGKSTIGQILESLLGSKNVQGMDLNALSSQFGLAPLRHKLLGVFSDVRFDKNRGTKAVVQKLLSISGEDTVFIDIKNSDQVSEKLTARLLIISNEIPQLYEANNALVGRFIILETKKSFFGKEDRDLKGKLYAELPQILNWALIGLERLLTQGHFIQPKSSEYRLNEMMRISNPIAAFIDDCCNFDEDSYVPKDVLFAQYEWWCIKNGYKYIRQKDIFARELLNSHDDRIKPAKRTINDQRVPVFVGIALKREFIEENLENEI